MLTFIVSFRLCFGSPLKLWQNYCYKLIVSVRWSADRTKTKMWLWLCFRHPVALPVIWQCGFAAGLDASFDCVVFMWFMSDGVNLCVPLDELDQLWRCRWSEQYRTSSQLTLVISSHSCIPSVFLLQWWVKATTHLFLLFFQRARLSCNMLKVLLSNSSPKFFLWTLAAFLTYFEYSLCIWSYS